MEIGGEFGEDDDSELDDTDAVDIGLGVVMDRLADSVAKGEN